MKGDDAGVHEAWLLARARWSGVEVSEASYRTFVEERTEDLAAGDDLYLACACAAGDETAIQAFETTFFDELDVLLRRQRRTDLEDELRQQLRVKLFVARGDRGGAIGAYGGRGPLRRWFRMVAARALLNLVTRGVPETPATDDFLADMIGGGGDPELEYIKQGYRRAFQSAFEACLASLDEQDRTLLRAAFRDGLSVDAMATIHGVHRSTVARWVVKAHRRLVQDLRQRLMADLGIDRSELDSLFHLIFSRMELTLGERTGS
jgi:RNA polymerase sigma-70 factor (ECF subfamily)